MIELPTYEKRITLNDLSHESIKHCSEILINFMFENCKKNDEYIQYFRLRLKDNERNAPFAKDLLIEWAVNPPNPTPQVDNK
jgi:hypothetical protein